MKILDELGVATLWEKIKNYVSGKVFNPDDEDLVAEETTEGTSVMKLADRTYSPQNFSGKGYKILRKNIKPVSLAVTKIIVSSVPIYDGYISFIINGVESHVDVVASTDTTTEKVAAKIALKLTESMVEYEVSQNASTITLTRKFGGKVSTPSSFSAVGTGASCIITDSTKIELRNILTAVMLSEPNTIYEVRYDFDLDGETIEMQEGCTLKFEGGSLRSGNIIGNKTKIKDTIHQVFRDLTVCGEWDIDGSRPEWFGANGTNELDTYAIQSALNMHQNCILTKKTYIVSELIVIPVNHSIIGNQAKIEADDSFVVENKYNSVPNGTILYLHGREPIFQSDLDMQCCTLRDFKVFGKSTLIGLYIGCENKEEIEQSSNVNYSIDGYNIKDLFFCNCKDGIKISDCWNTEFNNIIMKNIIEYGIHICGQVVNNVFNNCRIYNGISALQIEGSEYGATKTYKRPEGCSFIGGFYGSSKIGINEVNSLAFYFSNLIIDLNSEIAFQTSDGTNMQIKGCYIYTNKGIGIKFTLFSTKNNNGTRVIRDCYFSGNSTDIFIRSSQNGIIITNNFFSELVEIEDADAWIYNNMWLNHDLTKDLIYYHEDYPNTRLFCYNNRFKIGNEQVKTNIPFDKNLAYVSKSNSGILSSDDYKEIYDKFADIDNKLKGYEFYRENAGGQPTYWKHLVSTSIAGEYNSIRVDGYVGTYNAPIRVNFELGNNGVKSGQGSELFGYVKTNNGLDLYFKGEPASLLHIVIFGSQHVLSKVDKEYFAAPDNIVYLTSPIKTDYYGEIYNIKRSGTTEERPDLNSTNEGFTFYDSTLKKMILWNGTTWVNMDGTEL